MKYGDPIGNGGIVYSRTPLRGAWIEILCFFSRIGRSAEVAPRSGVRGLKSVSGHAVCVIGYVAPRSGVRGLK